MCWGLEEKSNMTATDLLSIQKSHVAPGDSEQNMTLLSPTQWNMTKCAFTLNGDLSKQCFTIWFLFTYLLSIKSNLWFVSFPSDACGGLKWTTKPLYHLSHGHHLIVSRKPRDGDRLTGYNEARGHLIYSGSQSQILRGLIITVKASRS